MSQAAVWFQLAKLGSPTLMSFGLVEPGRPSQVGSVFTAPGANKSQCADPQAQGGGVRRGPVRQRQPSTAEARHDWQGSVGGGTHEERCRSTTDPNTCGALVISVEHFQMHLGCGRVLSSRRLTSSLWTRPNSGLTLVVDASWRAANEANVRGTWPTIATTMDRRRATLTRGIGRKPQIDHTSRAVR